jgi:acyl-CoA thioesterase-1
MHLGLAWGLSLSLAHAQTAGAAPTPGARVLVLGDSLSAEYGLAKGSGWVPLLQQKLQAQKLQYNVINASISGETSSGARSRSNALLQQHHPAVVIIELGGNDALRGLSLDATQDNLRAMMRAARQAKAKVLLLGMQMPPNYGADYTRRFASMYAQLAQQEHAALVPFFLRGIADAPDASRWFQADQIHPIAQAQPRLLDNVWPVLRPLL